jgi:hypothetical protein
MVVCRINLFMHAMQVYLIGNTNGCARLGIGQAVCGFYQLFMVLEKQVK